MDTITQAEPRPLPAGLKRKTGVTPPKPKKRHSPATGPLRPPLAPLLFPPRPSAIRDESAGATDMWFDFETFSELDIKKHGMDNYAKHPSTKPLLLGWAFDNYPKQVLDLTTQPIPQFIIEALKNPSIRKIAWNASFEVLICRHCLHIDLPLSTVFDPSALARKLTFPAKLVLACEAAGLTVEQGKDKTGTKLIKMFSVPNRNSAANIKAGQPAFFQRTEKDNPEEWKQFVNYCGQDVEAMRSVTKHLLSLGMWTQEDHEVWCLHERINERGFPVDLQYVTQADKLMRACDAKTLKALKDLTGVANPNSVAQLKTYCEEEEQYPIHSLAKDTVDGLLSIPPELEAVPPNVLELLTLRRELSGAGPKKLVAIQGFVSADNRLRNQHVFHGGRTGRFTGREVQTQNLPKPKPEYEERVADFTELIRRGQLPEDVSPSDAITGSIRSSFRAPEGRTLIMGDLSSIENRVLAWFAGCEGMLEVFRNNLDPYKSFGVLFFDKPYNEITKAERTICKPPVLGGGFGMSWRALKGYAEGMGVTLTDEKSEELISTFRREYHEVPTFWYNLEAAVKAAIALREVVEYQPSTPSTLLTIDATDPRIMKIILPSGRAMYYRQACLHDTMTPWGEMRPSILYVEPRSSGKTGKILHEAGDLRGFTITHGSKIVENVVQATARDILVEAMLTADKEGFQIIGHCHDEIICETSEETADTDLARLIKIMSIAPSWAPELPLAASPNKSPFYVK